MSRQAAILGCGMVDDIGIAGTSGTSAMWTQLGMEPPGTGKTMREVFNKSDPTFRRIDLLARSLVLACSAADLDNVLSEEQRHETAICVETDIGALATDIAFAKSIDNEYVQASIFPYSLTSTSLGEVAIRHQLHGPTVSMSVKGGRQGESIRESIRMLESGECSHAIAGIVNTLTQPSKTIEASMRAIVVILTMPNTNQHALDAMPWPKNQEDPFQQLAMMCR